jgi:hypothetical protein
MIIKTYNIQLPENLMYLGLHPPIHENHLPENLMYLGLHSPKHGKLHLCENFHSMNTCHLDIGQSVRKIPISKSKSCTDA